LTCILVLITFVSIYYDLILDEKSPELEMRKMVCYGSPLCDQFAKPGARVLGGF